VSAATIPTPAAGSEEGEVLVVHAALSQERGYLGWVLGSTSGQRAGDVGGVELRRTR